MPFPLDAVNGLLERLAAHPFYAGRLPAGERLPASRELASSLGLSRNTVNQAYQTLTDEGLLRAHVGQGTFVAGRGGLAAARERQGAVPGRMDQHQVAHVAGRQF